MTPQKALQNLRDLKRQVNASGETHDLLAESLRVLGEVVDEHRRTRTDTDGQGRKRAKAAEAKQPRG